MDMYYRLREELLCQDCKTDLKLSKETGWGYFAAVCPGCGAVVEIEFMTRFVGFDPEHSQNVPKVKNGPKKDL